MNRKSKKETSFDEVKAILCQYWDPIELYNSSEDWDSEYDSYVLSLSKDLNNGKDYSWIKSKLHSIATINMGVDKHNLNAKNEATALALIALVEKV